MSDLYSLRQHYLTLLGLVTQHGILSKANQSSHLVNKDHIKTNIESISKLKDDLASLQKTFIDLSMNQNHLYTSLNYQLTSLHEKADQSAAGIKRNADQISGNTASQSVHAQAHLALKQKVADNVVPTVASNAAAIAKNQEVIVNNTSNIVKASDMVATNAADIAENVRQRALQHLSLGHQINSNAIAIGLNAEAVGRNRGDIIVNQNDIKDDKASIAALEQKDVEHDSSLQSNKSELASLQQNDMFQAAAIQTNKAAAEGGDYSLDRKIEQVHSGLGSSISDLKTKHDSHESAIAAAHSDLASNRSQIEEMQGQDSKHTADIASNKIEIDKLDDELHDVEQDLAIARADIDSKDIPWAITRNWIGQYAGKREQDGQFVDVTPVKTLIIDRPLDDMYNYHVTETIGGTTLTYNAKVEQNSLHLYGEDGHDDQKFLSLFQDSTIASTDNVLYIFSGPRYYDDDGRPVENTSGFPHNMDLPEYEREMHNHGWHNGSGGHPSYAHGNHNVYFLKFDEELGEWVKDWDRPAEPFIHTHTGK